MKYVKLLGLLAIAAATLMAFAGTASATTATSPKGTVYTGTYKGEAEGQTTLHGPVTITCGQSTVEGSVEQHGSGVTTVGKVSSLTFTECNNHITVLKTGTLEAHATVSGDNADGTLTSTGAEISIQLTSLGITCIYGTNNTDIGTGTLTSSTTTGGNATVDVASAAIPRTGGSIFCGSSGIWTGSYKVVNPSTLYIDE
ncbi:MAG TPA: hypothetical protein VK480_06235 [Solirubrobacterales bacterium]|nr:hypothetical protein [Solirubrobacterales bacterium]